MVLLTIVTILYITSPKLINLISESLYFSTHHPFSAPNPPPLTTTNLFSVKV